MSKITSPIFDNLRKPVLETEFVKKNNVTLWKKAKPSDGTGARFRNKTKGIELLAHLDENAISTIFLTSKFTDLPLGLKFEMNRVEVNQLLGKPDWSLEKGGEGIFAITSAADKWFNDTKDAIRIEYDDKDESIIMVSISSAKTEERFL